MRRRQIPAIASRFPWLAGVEAATLGCPKEGRHLVGVSGGADSRVLLHVLQLEDDQLIGGLSVLVLAGKGR